MLFDGPTAAGPNVTIVDDYAHHPTEVEASLRALRQRHPGRFLTVVFQPHLYSRTAPLIDEFAAALSHADEVILTDIYPAREDPMPGVSSARIAERITVPVKYVPSRHLLPQKVARRLRDGQVLVAMGAGNIGEFAPRLVEELRRPPTVRDGQIARPLEVAVIYGGDSAEREVSLNSGRTVRDALTRKGHQAQLMDVSELLLGGGDVSRFVGADRPDVAFLAVHGTNAEDGALQGFFELLHLPYTGSGIQASAIAMDKALTKQVLARHGIRVPTGVVLSRDDLTEDLRGVPTGPWVVKPNAQGSTVGLSFVEDRRDLRPAIERALAYGDQVLVEEWVKGTEISVPVLNGRVLPAVEIVPASGAYDFASKYLPGATLEICPARISASAAELGADLALGAHRALGCAGATRTDMIVRGEELFVLEVNNLPGLTGTSLLPNAAKAAGIDYDTLIESMTLDALVRDAAKG